MLQLFLIVLQTRDQHFGRTLFAVAQIIDIHGLADGRIGDDAGQFTRIANGLAVKGQNEIAAFARPGFRGGAVWRHIGR